MHAHLPRRMRGGVSFWAVAAGDFLPDFLSKFWVYGITIGERHYGASVPHQWHRGWPGMGVTHTVTFGLVVAAFVWLWRRNRAVTVGVALGCVVHVVADLGDTAGVMLLFPFSTASFTLALWAYGATSAAGSTWTPRRTTAASAWSPTSSGCSGSSCSWRALTRDHWLAEVVPAEPGLWRRLGTMPERALLALYRGLFFFGLCRMIAWTLWAHVLARPGSRGSPRPARPLHRRAVVDRRPARSGPWPPGWCCRTAAVLVGVYARPSLSGSRWGAPRPGAVPVVAAVSRPGRRRPNSVRPWPSSASVRRARNRRSSPTASIRPGPWPGWSPTWPAAPEPAVTTAACVAATPTPWWCRRGGGWRTVARPSTCSPRHRPSRRPTRRPLPPGPDRGRGACRCRSRPPLRCRWCWRRWRPTRNRWTPLRRRPWTPTFVVDDDLDGLLNATSPLLSRAFGQVKGSGTRPTRARGLSAAPPAILRSWTSPPRWRRPARPRSSSPGSTTWPATRPGWASSSGPWRCRLREHGRQGGGRAGMVRRSAGPARSVRPLQAPPHGQDRAGGAVAGRVRAPGDRRAPPLPLDAPGRGEPASGGAAPC